MPRPPKVTADFRALILRVVRARRSLPTDKDLAAKGNVSIETVRSVIKREFAPSLVVSCETILAHDPAPCPSDAPANPSAPSSDALPAPSASTEHSPS